MKTATDQPLDTIDTGGGCQALGFEIGVCHVRPTRQRDVEVSVLITRQGQLPEEGRHDNRAALYIDGDERAHCFGTYDETIAWTKKIRSTLEGIDKAGHFQFISWDRLVRHFKERPRAQGPPKFYSTAQAEQHLLTIAHHGAHMRTDLRTYRDPALFDPYDLGEIGHALEQLRRICGVAAAEHGDEDLEKLFPARDDRSGS